MPGCDRFLFRRPSSGGCGPSGGCRPGGNHPFSFLRAIAGQVSGSKPLPPFSWPWIVCRIPTTSAPSSVPPPPPAPDGIIMPKDRTAPVSATVYKVSAGTVVAVDLCQVGNLSATLNVLQDNGLWVFGLDGAAEATIFDLDLTVPLCLVIGSEGKGIRPLVRRSCDTLAAIPLAARVESLNASAAAAVALFEVVRQRRGRI